jgi:adenylate cyclase
MEAELSLALPNPDERHAERCLKEALDIAGRHQTRALELRAATSLYRLWRRQNKLAEAQRSLSDVTRWFTEGRETADLMEAEQLLAAGARVP